MYLKQQQPQRDHRAGWGATQFSAANKESKKLISISEHLAMELYRSQFTRIKKVQDSMETPKRLPARDSVVGEQSKWSLVCKKQQEQQV